MAGFQTCFRRSRELVYVAGTKPRMALYWSVRRCFVRSLKLHLLSNHVASLHWRSMVRTMHSTLSDSCQNICVLPRDQPSRLGTVERDSGVAGGTAVRLGAKATCTLKLVGQDGEKYPAEGVRLSITAFAPQYTGHGRHTVGHHDAVLSPEDAQGKGIELMLDTNHADFDKMMLDTGQ